MPNKNILIDNKGNKIFDNAGHLVLLRALGINRRGVSANGANVRSDNGALTIDEPTDPYYIGPIRSAFSRATRLNNFAPPFDVITVFSNDFYDSGGGVMLQSNWTFPYIDSSGFQDGAPGCGVGLVTRSQPPTATVHVGAYVSPCLNNPFLPGCF